MTKKEAKEFSLREWGLLRDNPSIAKQSDIRRIEYIECSCLLCEVHKSCGECPLYFCTLADGTYVRWIDADTDEKRADAASAIYEKINAWNIEEDAE
jgi:hypothetical protein